MRNLLIVLVGVSLLLGSTSIAQGQASAQNIGVQFTGSLRKYQSQINRYRFGGIYSNVSPYYNILRGAGNTVNQYQSIRAIEDRSFAQLDDRRSKRSNSLSYTPYRASPIPRPVIRSGASSATGHSTRFLMYSSTR